MRWKTLYNVAILIIGLVAGFALGRLRPTLFNAEIDTEWRQLVVGAKNFGISYSSQVVFSDLPIGEVTELAGRAKFLDAVSSSTRSSPFGYLINIAMSDPERSKIPEKYLKESTTRIDGQEVVSPPLEHVYYAIAFTFVLKDKDGFELLRLVSKEETLISGQVSKFQSTVEKPVPYETALKVQSVEVLPSIVKCHTCNG